MPNSVVSSKIPYGFRRRFDAPLPPGDSVDTSNIFHFFIYKEQLCYLEVKSSSAQVYKIRPTTRLLLCDVTDCLFCISRCAIVFSSRYFIGGWGEISQSLLGWATQKKEKKTIENIKVAITGRIFTQMEDADVLHEYIRERGPQLPRIFYITLLYNLLDGWIISDGL